MIILLALAFSCQTKKTQQLDLKNEKIKNYSFLKEMYQDSYFPNDIVDKGKMILVDLCATIEKENPKSLQELYIFTHKSTNDFNALQEDFWNNDSEIETAARECIALDFEFISVSYGFEADVEELIATRDW